MSISQSRETMETCKHSATGQALRPMIHRVSQRWVHPRRSSSLSDLPSFLRVGLSESHPESICAGRASDEWSDSDRSRRPGRNMLSKSWHWQLESAGEWSSGLANNGDVSENPRLELRLNEAWSIAAQVASLMARGKRQIDRGRSLFSSERSPKSWSGNESMLQHAMQHV